MALHYTGNINGMLAWRIDGISSEMRFWYWWRHWDFYYPSHYIAIRARSSSSIYFVLHMSTRHINLVMMRRSSSLILESSRYWHLGYNISWKGFDGESLDQALVLAGVWRKSRPSEKRWLQQHFPVILQSAAQTIINPTSTQDVEDECVTRPGSLWLGIPWSNHGWYTSTWVEQRGKDVLEHCDWSL